jgi:hypothetical protein
MKFEKVKRDERGNLIVFCGCGSRLAKLREIVLVGSYTCTDCCKYRFIHIKDFILCKGHGRENQKIKFPKHFPDDNRG